jgi:hypothetical protein
VPEIRESYYTDADGVGRTLLSAAFEVDFGLGIVDVGWAGQDPTSMPQRSRKN